MGTLNRMTNEDNHKGLPLHKSDRPDRYGTTPHYGADMLQSRWSNRVDARHSSRRHFGRERLG